MTWSARYPNLEIFDAEFISENVYSPIRFGSFTSREQGRRLRLSI